MCYSTLQKKCLLQMLLEYLIKNLTTYFLINHFSNCYKTISKSADINLLINYNNLLAFSDVFIEGSVEKIHFSEWTATDVELRIIVF